MHTTPEWTQFWSVQTLLMEIHKKNIDSGG